MTVWHQGKTKIYNKVVAQKQTPTDYGNLWLDITDKNNAILKWYREDQWVPVSNKVQNKDSVVYGNDIDFDTVYDTLQEGKRINCVYGNVVLQLSNYTDSELHWSQLYFDQFGEQAYIQDVKYKRGDGWSVTTGIFPDVNVVTSTIRQQNSPIVINYGQYVYNTILDDAKAGRNIYCNVTIKDNKQCIALNKYVDENAKQQLIFNTVIDSDVYIVVYDLISKTWSTVINNFPDEGFYR